MFRVPYSALTPTFDTTFKVSFGRWLMSSKTDRAEWMRRRNLAAEVAQLHQVQKIAGWAKSWEQTVLDFYTRRAARKVSTGEWTEGQYLAYCQHIGSKGEIGMKTS